MMGYSKMFSVKQPLFSSLNMEVVPDQQFVEQVSAHQPKFDLDVLRELLKQVGFSTPDERVLKVVSIMMEDKLLAIIDEVKCMQAQSQQARKKQKDYAIIQQIKKDNQLLTDQVISQIRTQLR
mmetsp:Transcript_10689/g.17953  ORF Transcript_10689/g.17953 Transcript_10689/m.17953 type:complete len:123 (+) Transcript_10689:572-940(+)